MSLRQLLNRLCFKENFAPDDKVCVVMMWQDHTFICDLMLQFAGERNLSSLQFDDESVFVNHLVMAFAQLALNLHAKTDELKNLFLVKPVSYTHLRAHETRHDLVCRLLLEK